MAGVVSIISRWGLKIDASYRNQPNKKLALYKLLIHFKSCTSNKMEWFSYKGGCNLCGSMHIKAFKRRVDLDYR